MLSVHFLPATLLLGQALATAWSRVNDGNIGLSRRSYSPSHRTWSSLSSSVSATPVIHLNPNQKRQETVAPSSTTTNPVTTTIISTTTIYDVTVTSVSTVTVTQDTTTTSMTTSTITSDTTSTTATTTTTTSDTTSTSESTFTPDITTTSATTSTTSAIPIQTGNCGEITNPYTAQNGKSYSLRCGSFYSIDGGEEIDAIYDLAYFSQCLDACAANDACVGIDYDQTVYCALLGSLPPVDGDGFSSAFLITDS